MSREPRLGKPADELPRGRRRFFVLFGFALTTGVLLASQLVLSRLFASTLGCYYAFAIVSLAMLGLAAGGLMVQLAPRFFAPERLAAQAVVALCTQSACCFAATLGYLELYPRLERGSWLVSLAVFGGFFPFFLSGGTTVSLVLLHGRASFPRLYALDLASAALGVLAALGLLAWMHPVEVTLYALALVPLCAALAFALAGSRRRLLGIPLASLVLATVAAVVMLRDPLVSDPPHTSRIGKTRVLHAANTTSNVSVFESTFFSWALSPRYEGPELTMLDLLIDGVGGTEIVEFDGRAESLRGERYAYLDQDLTALGQRLVPKAGRHLIVGPGGGVDVLQSVRRGRTDITAVEINPLVARVVNQDLAGFSGRPYQLPGVRVFIENGRTFAERTRESWDLVSLTWVDTGGQASAMASSENYLYTVESYARFLDRLAPDGCFAFMRALGIGGDLRIDGVRGVSVAVEALRRRGVQEPENHLVAAAVASPAFGGRAMLYVLLKRSALTPEEVAFARGFLGDQAFTPLWLPGGVDPGARADFSERARLVQEIVTTRNPADLHRRAPLDIAPSTDDNPFYFVERAGEHRAAGAGVAMLERILSVLGLLVLPFLLVPMLPVALRTRRLGAAGGVSIGYFALLGTGFMLIEVELFQVYALVLGSPTWALATVLCTLLIASGAGSLCAARLARAGHAHVIGVFAALVTLLAAFATLKGPLLVALVGLPFSLRIAGSVLTLSPLAFLMGLPLATGMTWIADRRDLVLWGWALNGSFSVLASVVAVFSAIHFGFARTFFAGVACYALAGAGALVLRARAGQGTKRDHGASRFDAEASSMKLEL